MSSGSIPLDVQNLFEEQIDNRIDAAIKRYDARSGEYPAVVTRKGGDGMWWCRVVGNEEETPIMTTLTDMEVGDTIRLLIKDGRTFAEGNETSPSTTSASVNTYVQASLNPVLADLKELSLDTATVKNLVAKKASIEDLEAERANIEDLQAITADISDIRANAAKVENLTAAQLEADHATVGSISSTYATITSLNAATGRIDDLEASTADIATIRANSAKVANLTAAELEADHATVGSLGATYATITNLNAATGRIDDLEADHVTVSDFQAEQGYIDALQSATADIATIRANSAKVANLTAAQLEADHATVGSLDANYAQVNLANVDNAWVENGTIKDGAITNAMINSVSANKLTAGTIDASNITVTNLNASNITTGTINGQRIGAGSLSLDKLSEDVYTETEVDGMLATMQAEIDGAIETWTGTAVPTLNNTPASSWTTNAIKDTHVGDVYFVVNSESQQNGYNYRFTKSGTTYSWQLIKDNDVTQALSRLTTAEGKITSIEAFDETVSSHMTNTNSELTSVKNRATSLETRMTDAEGDISTKVETTTFNTLSQTVDGHTQSINSLSSTVTTKADSSTVTSLTNRVSATEQDIDGIETTIGTLNTTVASKADSSTVTTISNKLNTVEDTVDGHTQSISSINSTLSSKADGSTVSALSTKVNTIEDTVDGHTQTIGSLTSTVNANETDIENKYSTLSQTVSGFQTTVSSTYATKTELSAETQARETLEDTVGISEAPYTEVEWVESNGKQFIQLDWIPSAGFGFDVDFMLCGSTWGGSGSGIIFGSRDGASSPETGTNRIFSTWVDGGPNGTLRIPNSDTTYSNISAGMYTDGSRQQCSLHGTTYTKADGTTVTVTNAGVAPTWGMTIFAGSNMKVRPTSYGSLEYWAKVRIYSLKFYDGNNLAVDLVPAVRKSDSVPGLYDKVANHFWACRGLSCGNEVRDFGEPLTLSDMIIRSNIVLSDERTADSRLWIANAPMLSSLEDGQRITIRTQWNTASEEKVADLAGWQDSGSSNNGYLKLGLASGSSDWVPMYYGSTSRLTSHYGAGNDIVLTYRENVTVRGSYPIARGWWADANYTDGNERYDVYSSTAIAGKNGVGRYTLCMKDDESNWTSITATKNSSSSTGKTAYTGGLQLGKVLYHTTESDYAAGANTGYLYQTQAVDLRYSFNGFANAASTQLQFRKPFYIVGTLSEGENGDGLFYLDTTQWWTQTPNQTGKVYILVGQAYSSYYQIYLSAHNPSYIWDGEKLVEFSYSRIRSAETAIEQTNEAISLKANSSDVYTKTQTNGLIETEVTNRNAAITASANSITSSVASTYATKTELNSIEIGGRNLLRHTSSPTYEGNHSSSIVLSETTGWYRWNSNCTVERTTDGIKLTFGTSSDSTGFVIPFGEDNALLNNEEAVLSFDYKTDLTSTGALYLMRRTSGNLTTSTYGLTASETEWQHFSQVVKWTSSTTTTGFYGILIPYRSGSGSWIEIRDRSMKLEKGNKATDWTPAPEDIETRVSSAESSITQNADNIELKVSKDGVISSINQSAETVKIQASKVQIDGTAIFNAISSDVDSAITGKGYATTTQAQGYATTAKNEAIAEIPTNVSELTNDSNYATTTDVSDAVDAIEVGGRNLLGSTDNPIKPTVRQSSADMTFGDIGLYNTSASEFEIEGYDSTTNTLIITSTVTGNRGVSWYTKPGDVRAGETYTFSCRVKSDVAVSVHTHTAWRNGAADAGYLGWTASGYKNIAANTWTDYSFSFTPASDAQLDWEFMLSICFSGISTGVTFRVAHAKLERGNKATDWSPAPEDVAADISAVQTTANSANSQEQLIYKSVVAETIGVDANTTWVTDDTGDQNVWTTVRPIYDQEYPALFVATQRQTVDQSEGTTCTCTEPFLDNTTTIIDGGNIITGSITASQIAAGTITSTQLDVDEVITVGGIATTGDVDDIGKQYSELSDVQEGLGSRYTSLAEQTSALAGSYKSASESIGSLDDYVRQELATRVAENEGNIALEAAKLASAIEIDAANGTITVGYMGQGGSFQNCRTRTSANGFDVINSEGTVVGHYGSSIALGSTDKTHIAAKGDMLLFLPAGVDAEAYDLENPEDKDQLLSQAVAYIATENDTSVFYMTRSVVVKDMQFGDGLWKWYKRSNNNMSLKWMGAI